MLCCATERNKPVFCLPLSRDPECCSASKELHREAGERQNLTCWDEQEPSYPWDAAAAAHRAHGRVIPALSSVSCSTAADRDSTHKQWPQKLSGCRAAQRIALDGSRCSLLLQGGQTCLPLHSKYCQKHAEGRESTNLQPARPRGAFHLFITSTPPSHSVPAVLGCRGQSQCPFAKCLMVPGAVPGHPAPLALHKQTQDKPPPRLCFLFFGTTSGLGL